jgi:hypothetical protein
MRKSLILVAVLGCAAIGCGHVTHVRPTPEGRVAAEVELGGPLAKIGSRVLPLPLTTLGASYGIAPRADVSAHVHATTLAFGVAGLDVGGSYLAVEQTGAVPGVNLSSRLYGFTDLKGFRPYLEVTAAASYVLAERFTSYLSASSLVQTGGRPLLSFAAGEELAFGDFGIQAEFRWYEPELNTQYVVVDWLSIANQGGWGIVLGARLRFGQPKGATP